MPDWSVKDDLESGHLVRLFDDFRISYAAFENGIYAVYKPSRYMSAKVRVFIDFLVAVCKERFA
jgi:DNA-binding transcriptional LysR family regulator